MMQEASRNYPDTAQTAPQEALGAVLAQARRARGLEQRDVSVRLGLSSTVIKALEDSDFERLGPPVFVRGYLMRYAELLGLPEQEILARYKRIAPSEPPPLRVRPSIRPQAKMSDTAVRWFSYLLIFGVVGYLGWLGLEQMSSHLPLPGGSRPAQSAADGPTALTLPPPDELATPAQTDASAPVEPASPVPPSVPRTQALGSAPQGIAITPTPPVPGPGSAQEQGSVAPLTQESLSAVAPVAEVPAELSATLGEAPSPAGAARLELAFTEDCWVDVTDADGQRLAYGVMKANSVHTLFGPPPFRITLGNATATTITLSGEPVDKTIYLPERGTVSRFVLRAPQAEE